MTEKEHVKWIITSATYLIWLPVFLFLTGVLFGLSGSILSIEVFGKVFYLVLPLTGYILLDYRKHFGENFTGMEKALIAVGFSITAPLILFYSVTGAALAAIR